MEDPSIVDGTINAVTTTNNNMYPSTSERRTCLLPRSSPYQTPAITDNPIKASASKNPQVAVAQNIRSSSSTHSEQSFKLRGLNLPGMGMFDGGGPKARSRYARKPASIEEELKNSSIAVQNSEVVGKKTRRVVANKKDGTATARVPTQPVRNQDAVNTKFGKRADWRVSKVHQKQKRLEVLNVKEVVERLEKRDS